MGEQPCLGSWARGLSGVHALVGTMLHHQTEQRLTLKENKKFSNPT